MNLTAMTPKRQPSVPLLLCALNILCGPTASAESPAATTAKPATSTVSQKPAETPTAPADAVFSRFDKNGDGKVTPDELTNPRAFERFDLDKDGSISLAEYNRVSGKTAAKTPDTSTPHGTPNVAGGGMAAQIEKMIKAVDKNAEFAVARLQHN